MLKIRLQRIGKRGQAYFRVVVMEHTKKPKGKYLEDLGAYDPHKNEISVDAERVKYWLSHGAQASPTVNNLLVDRGVIEGKKVQVWKAKKTPLEPTAAKGGLPPTGQVGETQKGPEVSEQKTEPAETNKERKTEEGEASPEPMPAT